MSKRMTKAEIDKAIIDGANLNAEAFNVGVKDESLLDFKNRMLSTHEFEYPKWNTDSPMRSFTVVLNSKQFNPGTPHISNVETTVKARDFDEAVALVKLLKFEVELEITSISKDHR